MDAVCVDCGVEFARLAGLGRPRIRCESCSPPQRRAPRKAKCARCATAFSPRGNQKYCDRSCRDKDVWDRQKADNPCPKCGGPMSRRSRSSASEQTCRGCRIADHGELARYEKHGCRCDRCKAAKRAENRTYYKARKAAGRPTYRATAGRCDYCSGDFLGRAGQRFCSVECAVEAQGRSPAPRFKVARSLRLAIYEADGWVCRLCEQPVRGDVDPNHPRYPTLDHIVPRARGGSDDRDNLRLACRQCNTLRGTNVGWVPVRAVA